MISATLADNGTFAALSAMQNIAPLTNGLIQGAEYLREQLARYPTQWHHRHIPEWTTKQRGWFFRNLKLGTIVVPRTRTQELANSWVVQAMGLTATVGTALPSAIYTMKAERLTMYHWITGWESAQLQAARAETRIVAFFSAGVAQWVG